MRGAVAARIGTETARAHTSRNCANSLWALRHAASVVSALCRLLKFSPYNTRKESIYTRGTPSAISIATGGGTLRNGLNAGHGASAPPPPNLGTEQIANRVNQSSVGAPTQHARHERLVQRQQPRHIRKYRLELVPA